MKKLLLLRHGKAVGTDPAGDHSRALNGRGRRAAKEVGLLLHRLGLEPDMALVSDARRTRETAEHTIGAVGGQIDIRYEPRLYAASAQIILSVLQNAGGKANVVLIVGHNPGIGDLARGLAATGEPQALIGLQGSFPTAALAVLEFGVADWREVAMRTGTLTRFIVPNAAEPGE
jgi:phosphohistidine phosphatase